MTANPLGSQGAGQSAISAEIPAALLPLSSAQRRLWLLLHQSHLALNLQAIFGLEGNLRLEALQQASTKLLQRHEMLRARIAAEDNGAAQVVDDAGTPGIEIEVVDLSSLDAVQRTARAAFLAQADREYQFDLAKEPLLRVSLLHTGAGNYHLIVTMPCIIADDQSLEVLMRDLAELYAAQVEKRTSALPSISIQYSEHVLKQQEWIQGELAQHELEYWKTQLSGRPARLDLPTDYPRLSTIRSGYAPLSFSLSPELTSGLSQLAQKEGVSLFVLLLSAFQVFLSRYSGQADISVAAPASGRAGQTENTIGLFENTVVLRADLSGDPSFVELLNHVKSLVAIAQRNESVPFEELVTILQPGDDPACQSIFQAMLTLRTVPQTLQSAGLSMSMLNLAKPVAMPDLDLSLELYLQSPVLKGRLNYAIDLFAPRTIVSLKNHFSNLLGNICASPNRSLSQFALLDNAERHQLLTQRNETTVAFPDKCIHELVSEQALQTPNAVAILDESHQLTYRELENRSNRLAQHLRSLGAGPEVVVGLCVQRSPEMVIGLLGILKAGSAYLPLDTSYPHDRLEGMIQDSHVEFIVANPTTEAKFPSYTGRWILIDGAWNNEHINSLPNASPKTHVLPENPAYVIYTSGSTGRPKGVAVTHRSVVALLSWAREYFSPEYTRTSLCATPISFDPSIIELFLPLISGGRGFVVENLFDLAKASVKHEITMIANAPSAMPALLEQAAFADNMKLIILGSEKLQYSVAHALKTRTKIERLQNVYGPTEDTLFSTTTPVEPQEGMDPFLGHPIANTQIYILDQHYEPVPINVTGEIYISGKGLARGYYEKPHLTAERFVPNPFRDGERMYATGDLARYREGMEIEFLGRKDHQVKIRGFRIELGEIEALLAELPEIRSAIVNAWQIHPGHNQLVAYLVPAAGQMPDLQEVRNHLADRLPGYMMPASFTILESLPTTASGKVDRGQLPKPERPKDSVEATQDITESEGKVAAIWQEVLRVDSIGLDQDFFELGGQSLLALIASAKLSETFSQLVSMKDHYTFRTTRQMADAIDHGNLTGEDASQEQAS